MISKLHQVIQSDPQLRGTRVEIVRERDGVVEVVLEAGATPTAQARANEIARTWRPSRRDRVEREGVLGALLLLADDPEDPDARAVVEREVGELRDRLLQ